MTGKMLLWSLLVSLVIASGGYSAEFATKPRVTRSGKVATVTFAVTAGTDVEVGIVNARGEVVRHLAGGVLGGENPPPPPLRPGLGQAVEWDGNDDYGQPVADVASCSARVRIGMGVKLDKIVGGDPYAFISHDMNRGDHTAWYIGGMERKPDGTVYIAGSINQLGLHTIRQYDANGNYMRTVFPPPAGLAVEKMKAWGLNTNADGTYTLQFGRLESPFLSTTLLCTDRTYPIRLLPTGDKDALRVVARGYREMSIAVDGTPAEPDTGCFIKKPAFPTASFRTTSMFGPLFTCLAPDGKSFYMSGVFSAQASGGGSILTADESGFWHDGQVWKVDLATREATPFFDLGKVIARPYDRVKSPIHGAFSYSELHGVAVDKDGRVFVCDRLNKRVIVLDQDAKIVRELPVEHPDDIAVGDEGVLYVTTRFGEAHIKGGQIGLLKFSDWRKDASPALAMKLMDHGLSDRKLERTYLLMNRTSEGTNVWVAHRDLPVRIYRDQGDSLELIKDFYNIEGQRCLSLYHMMADPKTENIYVSDGFVGVFRLTDWNKPEFKLCYLSKEQRLTASSFTIDPRNRFMYVRVRGPPPNVPDKRDQKQGIGRYKLDGEFMAPAPYEKSGSQLLTEPIVWNWVLTYGHEDFGMDIAPNGNFAALGSLGKYANDFRARLLFYGGDYDHLPWPATEITAFRIPGLSGCVRFDLHGNLYVGCHDGAPRNIPKGFAADKRYARNIMRIHKYVPTGSLAAGDLFPTQPTGPAKVYDVHFGAGGEAMFRRSARFGVDGYGRIYYPTSLSQAVSVIDNKGNRLLSFGTYGNRDSMGGLPGDKVPTAGIPMIYPNSVDATDNYIYVADLVNVRLLRIAKIFGATETAAMK